MSRNSTLILLGILVILVPFSGLPLAFRTLLAVIFGACIAAIGLSLRTKEMTNSAPQVAPPPVEAPPGPPQSISPI